MVCRVDVGIDPYVIPDEFLHKMQYSIENRAAEERFGCAVSCQEERNDEGVRMKMRGFV